MEKEEEETAVVEMAAVEMGVVETVAEMTDWEDPWRKRKSGPGCLCTTR